MNAQHLANGAVQTQHMGLGAGLSVGGGPLVVSTATASTSASTGAVIVQAGGIGEWRVGTGRAVPAFLLRDVLTGTNISMCEHRLVTSRRWRPVDVWRHRHHRRRNIEPDAGGGRHDAVAG